MTASLRAISVGCAVPRPDFEAAAHSVFHSALNLQRAGEPILLTLLLSTEPDLPQGIRLEAPKDFSFEGLPIGTRGVCRGGMLVLGNALAIDLREARRWDCDLSAMDADMTDEPVATAWLRAWDALRERRTRSGSALLTGGLLDKSLVRPDVAAQQLNQALRGILKATRQYDLVGMGELSTWVGLGPGLTPSGDDLLMGYLAGLWCTGRGKPERLRFLEAVGELVIRFSTRTNDIGRTYLCCAASGQVSSRLVALADAISRGASAARVLTAAESAMHVGHTSGVEAINGLLLGLAVWDGAHLLP